MNREYWLNVAERLRDRVRREPERKVEHLLAMADAYVKARCYDAAMLVSRSVLKLKPFSVPAMVRLGRCLLGTKAFVPAEKLYSTLVGLVPQLDEAAWGLWAAHKGRQQHRAAAETVEKLLERKPADERARRQAAEDREAAGDAAAAVRHLEILCETAAVDGVMHQRLGRLLLACNETSRALHHLEQALAENRQQPELLVLAAETAFGLRDWQKAGALAAERLESGEWSARALELLGRSRLEREEFDGAILALERLTDKVPDNVTYRLTLAEAYFRAGELRDAEVELNRCLARDPQRPATVLRLAEIAWRRSELDKAETLYERTLRLDPGQTLALFRLGLIKYERHLYPAALACFRRLMVAQPENVKAHLYLGRCLRITGSFDKAKNHLVRARELAPSRAEPELELGLLDLELHRTTLAREHFERAAALDPEGETGKRAAYELRHLDAAPARPIAVGEAATHSSRRGADGKPRWIKLC